MNEYEVGRFSDLEIELRDELWAFLNEHDNLIRLETASDLRAPAVEGVVRPLLRHFDRNILIEKRVKRFIGFITKQIMLSRGFELESSNVRVGTGNLFTKASRYQRRREKND